MTDDHIFGDCAAGESADNGSGSVGERDEDLRAALAGLAAMSMSAHDLPDMLTHVAEFAVQAIPHADGAGLTLLHDGRANTIVATAPFVREVDRIQYRIEQGPCITAADTGITTTSGSLSTDLRWPQFGPRMGRLGVHSVLSVPLIARHHVIGALNVFSTSVHAFDDDAVRLGEDFAVPAAVTVQNAHALADALRLARDLEHALHSRAVIDHAIGIIIGRTGVSATEAFDRLRAISQRENRKVRDVATTMVEQTARRARGEHRTN